MRGPYLVRYRFEEEFRGYLPVASHPLEVTLEQGAALKMPPIPSSMLLGCAPCPYCKNPGAGMCGCDALICLLDEPPSQVLCPCCQKRATLSRGEDDFSINQCAG